MTPVVALAPEDELVEKLLSNLEEVKSRGGTLYVFGNATSKIKIEKGKFEKNREEYIKKYGDRKERKRPKDKKHGNN